MKSQINPYTFFGVAAVIMTAVVMYLIVASTGQGVVLGFLGGLNITTFAFTGFDKNCARRGSLRVPEFLFFVWALLGGSVGLLVGTHAFRHKTRKVSFQLALLIVFCLQLYLLGYFGVKFWN